MRHLLVLALLAAQAPALDQQADPQLRTQAYGHSAGGPAGSSSALELSARTAEGGSVMLRLTGGTPGAAAVIMVGSEPADAEGPLGTRFLVQDGAASSAGMFGEDGVFALALSSDLLQSAVYAQGLLGSWSDGTLQSSNGLKVWLETPCAAVPAAPVFDPSQVHLDPNHMPQVQAAIERHDLEGLIASALGSCGDAITLEVKGSVSVEGMGGRVTLQAEVHRTDAGTYEVWHARGVAATLGISNARGVIGGSAKEIFTFATPGSAARGIESLALIEALGPQVTDAAEHMERIVQAASKAVAAARAKLEELGLGGHLRERFEALLGDERRHMLEALRQARPVQRALQAITEAQQIVEQHRSGYEVSFSATAELSLKLEIEGLSLANLGAGISGEGGEELAIHVDKLPGAKATRVSIAQTWKRKGLLEAKADVGAEAGAALAIVQSDVFVRDAQESSLHAGPSTVTFQGDVFVGVVEGGPIAGQRRAVARTLSVTVERADLDSGKMAAMTALVHGDAQSMIDALAGIPCRFGLQDRREAGMLFGLEVDVAGTGFGVGGSISWADRGAESFEEGLGAGEGLRRILANNVIVTSAQSLKAAPIE